MAKTKNVKIWNEGNLEGPNISLNAGPSTPVKVYTDIDGYGKKYKRVLPDFGAGRVKGKA